MKAIDIARKLAQLEQGEDACRAYALAIHENNGQDPAQDMESALYILEHGGDYRVSYTCFRNLYGHGHFREDTLSVMTQAFYQPNEEALRERYEKNRALLAPYPYFFREDFVPFEDLPIRFYPYDDDGYLPFFPAEERFGDYINFKNPVVSRNFFKDLEKPILAEDVYSQYELEYLRDNVRKSEHVARENHVYLHYTDWGTFCAHLQVLDLRPLLREQKLVFLIGEEISQYPIDFKQRFGIDYGKYTVKPVGVREVSRMIWHTQLSSHNGGDFFNEVFDAHPNLLLNSSVFFSNVDEVIQIVRKDLKMARNLGELRKIFAPWPFHVAKQLYETRELTDKDILVGLFLRDCIRKPYYDAASRIAPVVFFQPHFGNLTYDVRVDEEKQRAILYSGDYEKLRKFPAMLGFKYIKTFTPMRRPSTSYGASVKFMADILKEGTTEDGKKRIFDDALFYRIMNRSFMVDPQDRPYRDSVLVRFEDGKLNAKATFTALAAFLDIPYTESMTYCSADGKLDPESYKGNVRGFDPASVYKTYDEYANDDERYFLEYFLRDAYEYYGYDFHYYDGKPVDEAKVQQLIEGFTIIDDYIRETWKEVFRDTREAPEGLVQTEEEIEAEIAVMVEGYVNRVAERRLRNSKILMRGLRFVNPQGQPLRMMPALRLDPALLEQPLYH